MANHSRQASTFLQVVLFPTHFLFLDQNKKKQIDILDKYFHNILSMYKKKQQEFVSININGEDRELKINLNTQIKKLIQRALKNGYFQVGMKINDIVVYDQQENVVEPTCTFREIKQKYNTETDQLKIALRHRNQPISENQPLSSVHSIAEQGQMDISEPSLQKVVSVREATVTETEVMGLLKDIEIGRRVSMETLPGVAEQAQTLMHKLTLLKQVEAIVSQHTEQPITEKNLLPTLKTILQPSPQPKPSQYSSNPLSQCKKASQTQPNKPSEWLCSHLIPDIITDNECGTVLSKVKVLMQCDQLRMRSIFHYREGIPHGHMQTYIHNTQNLLYMVQTDKGNKLMLYSPMPIRKITRVSRQMGILAVITNELHSIQLPLNQLITYNMFAYLVLGAHQLEIIFYDNNMVMKYHHSDQQSELTSILKPLNQHKVVLLEVYQLMPS